MILKINPQNPQRRLIHKVVEVLKEGGVIVYPTDTIYGLGCDLYRREAIERIYRIKRASSSKRLSIICPDLSYISMYAQVTDYAYRLMRRLIPGPYTFILEASRLVPKIMLTRQRTIGIRVPDHPIPLAIVEELGNPIITTSVTRPDETLYDDPEELAERFKGQVDLVIDAGRILPQHSSIIDLTVEPPKVLRVGKGDVSFLQG
ncbi:MAG: threonylcarbamoyl-AMP synthase [Deltaproteobacteria bacterium]|nr:MAG: threonylcarbamoyl-AMP synthase [Deltaproteobacteria bacterium]